MQFYSKKKEHVERVTVVSCIYSTIFLIFEEFFCDFFEKEFQNLSYRFQVISLHIFLILSILSGPSIELLYLIIISTQL